MQMYYASVGCYKTILKAGIGGGWDRFRGFYNHNKGLGVNCAKNVYMYKIYDIAGNGIVQIVRNCNNVIVEINFIL